MLRRKRPSSVVYGLTPLEANWGERDSVYLNNNLENVLIKLINNNAL